MSTRKRWRLRLVPGGRGRAYPSKVALYRDVASARLDVRLGLSALREARVLCNDELYEVIDLTSPEPTP